MAALRVRLALAALWIGLGLAACTTSPLGRSQLRLFPAAEMDAMGSAAFQQIRRETAVSQDAALNARVLCVARAITRLTPSGAWEVVVFAGDEANAFALPGRKIGVYQGMARVAQSQDQLATVLAHEVAHVLADHSNERLSVAYTAQSGYQLVEILTGGSGGQKQLLALLGLGAQVGVLMPFARTQETEADLLGLDLMARAGFDPRGSIALWQNMAKEAQRAPPEFLSTHPSRESRIRDLSARMPIALEHYKRASHRPACY